MLNHRSQIVVVRVHHHLEIKFAAAAAWLLDHLQEVVRRVLVLTHLTTKEVTEVVANLIHWPLEDLEAIVKKQQTVKSLEDFG